MLDEDTTASPLSALVLTLLLLHLARGGDSFLALSARLCAQVDTAVLAVRPVACMLSSEALVGYALACLVSAMADPATGEETRKRVLIRAQELLLNMRPAARADEERALLLSALRWALTRMLGRCNDDGNGNNWSDYVADAIAAAPAEESLVALVAELNCSACKLDMELRRSAMIVLTVYAKYY